MGVPSAHFIMGYFVNQDLFEAANLDAPAYGFTVDEFKTAATELTDVNAGVLGLDENIALMGWYPNTVDPNLKWYSFDGEKMNYNSAAFKEGVALKGRMTAYTWQGLTEERSRTSRLLVAGAVPEPGSWPALGCILGITRLRQECHLQLGLHRFPRWQPGNRLRHGRCISDYCQPGRSL
jgi:hypothetical protein